MTGHGKMGFKEIMGTKGDKSLLLLAVSSPKYFLYCQCEIIVANPCRDPLIPVKSLVLSFKESFLTLGRESHVVSQVI
jgi:hypothetical protein